MGDPTDTPCFKISKREFCIQSKKTKDIKNQLEQDLINEKLNRKNTVYQLEKYKDIATRQKNELILKDKELASYRRDNSEKLNLSLMNDDNKLKDIKKIVEEKYAKSKSERDKFDAELDLLFS